MSCKFVIRFQLLLFATTLWLQLATCSQHAREAAAESRQCPTNEEAVAPPQTAQLLQQLRELVTAAEAADAALQTGLQQARHLLSSSGPDLGLAGELAVLRRSHAVSEQVEVSFSGTALRHWHGTQALDCCVHYLIDVHWPCCGSGESLVAVPVKAVYSHGWRNISANRKAE